MSLLSIHNTGSKILIIGPSWVGDMVMAQSLFIRIKEQQPNAIIDVLAPSWSRPIIERMPEVNRAIDMPLGHGLFKIGMRRTLGHQLRKERYDQAIVLPNSWKSALIPWFANIPLRTGWKGEMRYGLLNDCRTLDKQALPFMVERFVALAYPPRDTAKAKIQHCPIPALQANAANIPALLTKFTLHQQQPILTLCPGAEFGSSKQWPAAHYAATAKAMIAQGYQVWIMGSPADEDIALSIHQSLSEGQQSHLIRLCGKTSLEEAIDLLSIADHVISNDSGLMHIASALNKPLVALYGSTSSAFTPPLSKTAETLSIPVDCGPCFKRECPEKHHKCLQELYPEQVLKILMGNET
ncbi:ADP-heptose-lipooligosaccharide heptosyltransferase II [gamma proteobacterium IMCC1989]|nr:ADP-heptose-lipooligosaccharide heptosyltransferase II [gamma proteobacterium IMCC1989]